MVLGDGPHFFFFFDITRLFWVVQGTTVVSYFTTSRADSKKCKVPYMAL